jgi:hypothetical protein
MIADTERKFYRVDEAAAILGVDEPEIIRLVIDGKLILSAEVVRLLHYEYSSPCDDAPPYTDKECINGEWFTFSDTLRATSNQLLDIVQSYGLDVALKVLWSKAGDHKFSSLEGDGFQMILALEDRSYIRPITHNDDEWSHYVNIPNDIILGVKKESLDEFIAKRQSPKLIDEDGEGVKSSMDKFQAVNNYTKRAFGEFKAEKILHKTYEACANLHGVTRQAYTKAYKQAESKSRWGTQ